MYEIKQNNGHYELYVNGKFYCSTDTLTEAAREMDAIRYQTIKEEMCNGCPLRGW